VYSKIENCHNTTHCIRDHVIGYVARSVSRMCTTNYIMLLFNFIRAWRKPFTSNWTGFLLWSLMLESPWLLSAMRYVTRTTILLKSAAVNRFLLNPLSNDRDRRETKALLWTDGILRFSAERKRRVFSTFVLSNHSRRFAVV